MNEKTYKGNETVKKIIENDFRCNDEITGTHCLICPFRSEPVCHEYPEIKRAAVIDFIAREILKNGEFDITMYWTDKEIEILKFYYVLKKQLIIDVKNKCKELSEQQKEKSKPEVLDTKLYTQQCGRMLRASYTQDRNRMVQSGKSCPNCGVFNDVNNDKCVNCNHDFNCLKIMSNTPSPKYYVFNQQGAAPRHIHDSYESALEEAKRLSRKHHDNSFAVCQIKAIVKSKTEIDEV